MPFVDRQQISNFKSKRKDWIVNDCDFICSPKKSKYKKNRLWYMRDKKHFFFQWGSRKRLSSIVEISPYYPLSWFLCVASGLQMKSTFIVKIVCKYNINLITYYCAVWENATKGFSSNYMLCHICVCASRGIEEYPLIL